MRKALVILLAIGFVAAAGAAVVAISQFKNEYREMKSVRLDPGGFRDEKFPADVPADASIAAPLAVFFGDSRAEGWWPPPAVPGWRFANRGIYGQTTEQIFLRYRAHITPLKPKVIILQCGVNDLTAIGVMPDRRNAIVADCKRNLHRIIQRGVDDGAVVIVTTIFPVGRVSLARRVVWSDQTLQAIEDVNADLRAIHSPNVVVIDAFQLLQDHGRLRGEFSADMLHLNRAGYEALDAPLRSALQGAVNPPVQ